MAYYQATFYVAYVVSCVQATLRYHSECNAVYHGYVLCLLLFLLKSGSSGVESIVSRIVSYRSIGRRLPLLCPLLYDFSISILRKLLITKAMAHHPSSPPNFLVPETGTSKFAHVPCILVPDFSGTRILGGVGQCSIRHQKLGCT